MSKRKYESEQENKPFKSEFGKGHTLDSDEEDDQEDEKTNRLDDNDIEGEEDGISRIDDEDEVKITPFNMKEEMEEGHFDADGHYQFKKEKEIKDNWLDNIDWVKVKKDSNYKEKYNAGGLGDSDTSSDDDDEGDDADKAQPFDLNQTYKSILEMMQARESVKKTLQRLGGNKKISSAERWKRKKAGIVDDSAEKVSTFTGLCDQVLSKTGNMNIYEETFESISAKIKNMDVKKAKATPSNDDLDMYADDFDTKEQAKLGDNQPSTSASKVEDVEEEKNDVLMWEYKVDQEEGTEILGPYTSEQMQAFVDEGKFKEKNVFVRKVKGEEREGNFYSSSRIDFDLYI